MTPDKWRVGRKPNVWHVRREFNPLRFVPATTPPSGISAQLRRKLVELSPGRYTTAALRDALGLSNSELDRKRLSDALKPLREANIIRRIEKGLYERL